MIEEELFFPGQQAGGRPHQRTQGGGHLQRHQHKDDDPYLQAGAGVGAQESETVMQEPQPEVG